MSTQIDLTPTSYIVLGLLEVAGEATPYDLKRGVAASVGNFWSLPHSQLYAEPDRLARAGLVTVRREEGGRRRKHYALTDAGRAALAAWVADPDVPAWELRDPALLKLFFGADPAAIAPGQVAFHRERLARYEAIHAMLTEHAPREAAGPILTVELGIDHARISLAYWERIAEG